jgi:hypothetical protein
MVVLADNRLAEVVRADNPWFPIFDEERFRREIADMRADVLGEGKSPFPDRVKRREALRRRERSGNGVSVMRRVNSRKRAGCDAIPQRTESKSDGAHGLKPTARS